MGACNPSDRMREAAASDVEEFFIVATRIRVCEAGALLLCYKYFALDCSSIKKSETKRVGVLLWAEKRRS